MSTYRAHACASVTRTRVARHHLGDTKYDVIKSVRVVFQMLSKSQILLDYFLRYFTVALWAVNMVEKLAKGDNFFDTIQYNEKIVE